MRSSRSIQSCSCDCITENQFTKPVYSQLRACKTEVGAARRTKSTLSKVDSFFPLYSYLCLGCSISCVFVFGTRVWTVFAFPDLSLNLFIEELVWAVSELRKGLKFCRANPTSISPPHECHAVIVIFGFFACL